MYENKGRLSVDCSAELSSLVRQLSELATEADDAELIDRIGALERVKAAAAAAQARMTAAFVTSQRSARLDAGVPARRVDQGISAQVALAKRESPARAARYAGWAAILVNELPHTFAILAAGETTEWRAMVVARETIWLSRADRASVDDALADRLPTLGDHRVEIEVKKLAYRLDPEGFVARTRAASSGRRVTLRPAPDTMARLTALVPAPQGVAAYAALMREAASARAAGDPRGRGQVMADTLIERITGQSAATEMPVSINLVMTDRTLFGDGAREDEEAPAGNPTVARSTDVRASEDPADPEGSADPGCHDGADEARPSNDRGNPSSGDEPSTNTTSLARGETYRSRASGFDEPAHLIGYGPIPAGIARELARVKGAQVWLRRLFRHPRTGDLAALESRARIFPERIRLAIILRDHSCRTPWCGAPVRHADHARSFAEGGKTSLANGQGLCEACNYAKQSPDWRTTTGTGGTGESVKITTPTGHTYVSRPPELPGSPLHISTWAFDLGHPPRHSPAAGNQAA